MSKSISWFSRHKRPEPRVKTRLGTFTFDDTGWMTDPSDGTLVIQWIDTQLDTTAIERAEILLREIDVLAKRAIQYAKTNGADAWDCSGALKLEAIDITNVLEGRFGLTFGVAGLADFTVSVEFIDGEPTEVWGAD